MKKTATFHNEAVEERNLLSYEAEIIGWICVFFSGRVNVAVFFGIGCLLLAQNIGPLFFPNRCDAHEELKVDAWHWAGKH